MTDTRAPLSESIAVQRLARMSDVWKREQPGESEIDAAYARFRRRRAEAALHIAGEREIPLAWHFAMGVGVGCLSLLAIRTLVSAPTSQPETYASAASVPAPAEPVATAPTAAEPASDAGVYVLRGGVRVDVSRATSFDVGAGEVVDVVVAGKVQRFEGPGIVEIEVTPEDVSGWSCEFTPLLQGPAEGAPAGVQLGVPLGVAPSGSEAVGDGESSRAPQSWAEVARALAGGDHAAASRALEDLGQSESPRTRDAARLALAQLWLSEGDAERARPVLQQLAEQGATAVIRDRARDALARAGQ